MVHGTEYSLLMFARRMTKAIGRTGHRARNISDDDHSTASRRTSVHSRNPGPVSGTRR